MKQLLRILALILLAQVAALAQVKLQWDAPTTYTPTGYNVYRNNSGASFTPTDKINATPITVLTYTDNSCTTPGTSCFYTVTAMNGITESTASNVVRTDIPAPPQPLPAPTNLQAVCASGTSVTLSWAAVPSALSYYLRISDVNGDIQRIDQLAATSYTKNNVVPTEQYQWWVHSYNPAFPAANPDYPPGLGSEAYGPDFICMQEPPSNLRIVITTPQDGSSKRFNRNVSVRADAINGIRSELYADGGLLRAFNSGSFSYTWNPRTFRGKTVELKAKTYSTLGDTPVSESDPVHVTIR
jgi:hypothetical protein